MVEDLLKQAGIIRVRNLDEVFDCVKVLLLPRLKAVGDGLLHKTEAGAVRLNLENPEALKRELSAMASDPLLSTAGGFLIQEMVTTGVEIIVGAKNDPQFGPLVLVGMAGVMVELFSDISIRLAPLDLNAARRMVASLRCYPLLNGFRGSTPADIDSLCKIIQRVSHLAAAFPSIAEIDLNPVKVLKQGQGAVAVDCRIILNLNA